MKFKIMSLLLIISLLLSACTGTTAAVTEEEIVQSYEQAGYLVYSGKYDSALEHGITGYIKAERTDGAYIYFTIFESETAAAAYKEQYCHSGILGLFSVIFGEPSWVRFQVYGNMLVQYENAEIYDIFENLLKTK